MAQENDASQDRQERKKTGRKKFFVGEGGKGGGGEVRKSKQKASKKKRAYTLKKKGHVYLFGNENRATSPSEESLSPRCRKKKARKAQIIPRKKTDQKKY